MAEQGTIWPFYTQFFRDAYGCLKINKGDTVLDAGASVGFFSVYAASICKKVVAIEPGSESFRILNINSGLNKTTNIIPIKKALWNRPGYVRMIEEGTSTRVVPSNPKFNDEQTVPCITIDQLLQELHCTADVVKMDVEGSERYCLDGQYLRSVREIVIETHDTKEYVLNVLRNYGFSIDIIRFKTRHLFRNMLKHPLAFTHAALLTKLIERGSSITSTIKQELIVPQMGKKEVSLIYGRKRETRGRKSVANGPGVTS